MKGAATIENGELCFYRVEYFFTDLKEGYYEHEEDFVDLNVAAAKSSAALYAKDRLQLARSGEIKYFDKELGDIHDFHEDEDFLFAISLWEMQRDEEGAEYRNLIWSFEP